jgi:hypothetical protein
MAKKKDKKRPPTKQDSKGPKRQRIKIMGPTGKLRLEWREQGS